MLNMMQSRIGQLDYEVAVTLKQLEAANLKQGKSYKLTT
jgi:hypothetical protein